MASAAEQLAANINFSAFGKAEELKKRIWFTLGALVIYRLGTYIPLPGIRSRCLRGQFRGPQAGRARALQHVLRRRRATHGDLRAEHHALHLGLDHHPADDLGRALARGPQEGGRGRPQDHQPVHPLPHGRARRLPGLWHLGRPRGAAGRRHRPGLVLPHLDRHHPDGRDHVPDVAGRADHLARHRQRVFADHLRGHCGGLPGRDREHARTRTSGRALGWPHRSRARDGARRHRLHRFHGAGAAPAAHHLPETAGGQPHVRGADFVPAAQAQYLRRHSADLRLLAAAVAHDSGQLHARQRRYRHPRDRSRACWATAGRSTWWPMSG